MGDRESGHGRDKGWKCLLSDHPRYWTLANVPKMKPIERFFLVIFWTCWHTMLFCFLSLLQLDAAHTLEACGAALTNLQWLLMQSGQDEPAWWGRRWFPRQKQREILIFLFSFLLSRPESKRHFCSIRKGTMGLGRPLKRPQSLISGQRKWKQAVDDGPKKEELIFLAVLCGGMIACLPHSSVRPYFRTFHYLFSAQKSRAWASSSLTHTQGVSVNWSRFTVGEPRRGSCGEAPKNTNSVPILGCLNTVSGGSLM